jgi:hypothetical protein
VAKGFLDRVIGVRYGRQIGFALYSQVESTEPSRRDVIGVVREDVREAQFVVVVCHSRNGTVWDTVLARYGLAR